MRYQIGNIRYRFKKSMLTGIEFKSKARRKTRRVRESLLPWKNNKYYILLCACVRACARAALLIQHATRMRRIALFVASLAPQYFSTLSHKRHDFRKKVIKHKICVFIFSITLIGNIFHSKNNSSRYCHKCENVFMSSSRYSCQM